MYVCLCIHVLSIHVFPFIFMLSLVVFVVDGLSYIIGRFDLLEPVGHLWAGTFVGVIYLRHLLVGLTDVDGGAEATHLKRLIVVHFRLKIVALEINTYIQA